jgi:uncharacterized OsmC-like protein
MSAVAEKQVSNGVNVEALLGAREAVSKDPAFGQFTWRASCRWMQGTHSRASVNGFYGFGEERRHKTEYTFDIDHPEAFAASDEGATPVEIVLTALAGCLTAGVAAVAQQRKIQLRSVTARLEGRLDLRGILGADSDVRNGFNDVRVRFDIDADATREEIEALVAQSQKRSAVYDILTNPTNVSVSVN